MDQTLNVPYCAACGAPKSTPHCTSCGTGDASEQSPDLRRLERSLNWGGFFLTGFWPFWHGAVWVGIAWWIACLLSAVDKFMVVITIALSVYLLLRGNRIALHNRDFESPQQFCAVQRSWGYWGLATSVGGALAIFLLLAFLAVVIAHNQQP